MSCFRGLFSSPNRSSQKPRVTELETTTSTCTTEAVRRKHVYKIREYRNLLGRLKANEYVWSETFEVGGYHWRINYYPRGHQKAMPGYVSAFVEVMTPGAQARAEFDFRLASTITSGKPTLFRPVCDGGNGIGFYSIVKGKTVEASLRHDTIKIECTVTVFKKPTTTSSSGKQPPVVKMPPSELSRDLAKMLDPPLDDPSAPLADVLILVGAEFFTAHRSVLWMRCRDLHDRIAASSSTITVSESDVEPAVFRDVLKYIYTESLPAMDDLDSAQKAARLRGLLAAAVRYRMNRLTLVCQRTLSVSLDAKTVVATLAHAEQLQLKTLRSDCIKFITSSPCKIE